MSFYFLLSSWGCLLLNLKQHIYWTFSTLCWVVIALCCNDCAPCFKHLNLCVWVYDRVVDGIWSQGWHLVFVLVCVIGLDWIAGAQPPWTDHQETDRCECGESSFGDAVTYYLKPAVTAASSYLPVYSLTLCPDSPAPLVPSGALPQAVNDYLHLQFAEWPHWDGAMKPFSHRSWFFMQKSWLCIEILIICMHSVQLLACKPWNIHANAATYAAASTFVTFCSSAHSLLLCNAFWHTKLGVKVAVVHIMQDWM